MRLSHEGPFVGIGFERVSITFARLLGQHLLQEALLSIQALQGLPAVVRDQRHLCPRVDCPRAVIQGAWGTWGTSILLAFCSCPSASTRFLCDRQRISHECHPIPTCFKETPDLTNTDLSPPGSPWLSASPGAAVPAQWAPQTAGRIATCAAASRQWVCSLLHFSWKLQNIATLPLTSTALLNLLCGKPNLSH